MILLSLFYFVSVLMSDLRESLTFLHIPFKLHLCILWSKILLREVFVDTPGHKMPQVDSMSRHCHGSFHCSHNFKRPSQKVSATWVIPRSIESGLLFRTMISEDKNIQLKIRYRAAVFVRASLSDKIVTTSCFKKEVSSKTTLTAKF